MFRPALTFKDRRQGKEDVNLKKIVDDVLRIFDDKIKGKNLKIDVLL